MTVDGPTTGYVAPEDHPWVEGVGGAAMRLLSISETGTWVIQTRLPAGLITPPHRHTGRVYAFTTGGRWGYLEYDWWAEAGSFLVEEAGVTHTLVVPEDASEPAEVTYVVEGGNVYLDENGGVLFYEDARTTLADYVSGLEKAGHPVPAKLR
jgi:2,4'-dihydroxyacetophenone dioxygenase